ncbi:hypothetical protein ACLB2K_015561 [Fragaria x ananassa]
MGSSSSPSSSASAVSDETVHCYKYDVFLSFRGEDTRKGIIFNLYYELQTAGGIKTFKDDEGLEIGMSISSNLLRAIEESRLFIVVLSSNYASSTWCLEELVNIFRCMEGEDRLLPLFYHVDPSDVRNQRGSFGLALSKHEEECTQDQEKVKQWRIALGKVGSLSGWDTRNFKSERELVKHIVEFVCRKVPEVPPPVPIEISSAELKQEEHFSVGPYGSNNGGKSFDDGIYSTVRQLVICYDKQWINHIRIEYDFNGISLWSDTHGNPDGNENTTTVTLKLDYPDEFLTSMHGCYEKVLFLPTQITSLTFTSNKKTYGPFGSLAGVNFSINVPNSKMVGFHGRSSGFTGLRAIGAYLKPLES